MLRFYRKSFKAGVMKVTERYTESGQELVANYGFKPSDNGKDFEFHNEDYILDNYGAFFSVTPQ